MYNDLVNMHRAHSTLSIWSMLINRSFSSCLPLQFERDIMIWNNKQYLSKPLLVKEDAAIQRHRRWYSQFYSARSVKFTGQKNGLDW